MPSTASAYGLRPAYHPSGVIRTERGTIADGYATALQLYQPVKIGTDGTIQAAAAGERAVGTFLGVEWTDDNGRRQLSNFWTANTSGTEIVCYYTRDQNIVYEIQSTAAINQADVGNQADWVVTAGNATVGISAATLSETLVSSGSAGLRIIGIGQEPDNAFGDTFTNVLVQISEHQDVADQAAYGG